MADIKDTEIRFIVDNESTADGSKAFGHENPKKGSQRPVTIAVMIGIILLVGILFFWIILCISMAEIQDEYDYNDITYESDDYQGAIELIESRFEQSPAEPSQELLYGLLKQCDDTLNSSFCHITESTINGIPFRILLPVNAVPELHIGKIDESDPDIILALQAADVRKDNGKIVGACVNKGRIKSIGLAKKGFVAIISGKITIGVSEHSPLFEKAVDEGGDFFRQYPIVDQGFIVENNPKSLYIRRAICERASEIFVVETLIPVSFHDFSQMLVDFRVNNAVYLVGGQYACGIYRDADNQPTIWGEAKYSKVKNVSYLVWKKADAAISQGE
ncbi:MAG: hypothetical protein PUD83_06600 [Bacteroidales bacterium]|nr:hypothetical protein [Bacteroidales bacterium]